jgi:hypothetical protein
MLIVETIARIRREHFIQGQDDQGDRPGPEGVERRWSSGRPSDRRRNQADSVDLRRHNAAGAGRLFHAPAHFVCLAAADWWFAAFGRTLKISALTYPQSTPGLSADREIELVQFRGRDRAYAVAKCNYVPAVRTEITP